MRGFDKTVLRYGGYIDNQPHRRVLLVFYVASGEVGIFEQPARNTGTIGGKFLQPQRVKKPIPGNATLTRPAPCYEAEDFYVGAKVNMNGHIIILDQTDEQTIRVLEGAPKEFSVDDMNSVLSKVRQLVMTRYTKVTDAFRMLDKNHDGVICIDEFARICSELDMHLCPAEIMTLMRHLDINGDGVIDFGEFVERIQPPAYASELESGASTTITEVVTTKKPVYRQRIEAIVSDMEDENVFKLFRDKLNTQRSVFLDTFRLVTQRAFDAKIGIKEFTDTVTNTLFLNITDAQSVFTNAKVKCKSRDIFHIVLPCACACLWI
jgi:hypothetical protein